MTLAFVVRDDMGVDMVDIGMGIGLGNDIGVVVDVVLPAPAALGVVNDGVDKDDIVDIGMVLVNGG